jgi:hypothetical protein
MVETTEDMVELDEAQVEDEERLNDEAGGWMTGEAARVAEVPEDETGCCSVQGRPSLNLTKVVSDSRYCI